VHDAGRDTADEQAHHQPLIDFAVGPLDLQNLQKMLQNLQKLNVPGMKGLGVRGNCLPLQNLKKPIKP
jgi:hypothetical protein